MATANLTDLHGILPFEVTTDRASLGFRWARWLRSFDLYADGKGVEKHAQRKALLLHSAGMDVQDIFYTLKCPEPGETENVYSVCKKVLTDYFTPKVNVAFERSKFRGLAQLPDESIEAYATRLRQHAIYCDFTDVDENIRDQLIEKCNSQRLRRKLLEMEDPTLENCIKTALSLETSERQAEIMIGTVNKVHSRPNRAADQSKLNFPRNVITCYACGFKGHTKSDKNCPARGKTCRRCKNEGHFERCCRTRLPSASSSKSGPKVRSVEVEDVDDDEDDYIFNVLSGETQDGDLQVNVGGVNVPVIIDSGATVNIIDRDPWEQLKKAGIRCKSSRTSKRVYVYGHTKPLTVAGSFTTKVEAGTNSVDAEFLVVEEKGKALLSKQTSIDLGILHIQNVYHVNSTDRKAQLKDQFPSCFDGIGKLKDYQLHIPVDESVEPVIQGLRRVPYNLREKLEKKIDELESLDIIEKVQGTSRWCSPIVVVPKSDGDVRVCVDMRRANEAVLKEPFPIPTTEEILQDLNKSTVFSKLDIKMAFHQIELDEASREITTFMTHRGMYRYKRLLFGVSCAPEMYNKVLSQVLGGLDGVCSIFDDIVVHGQNVEQHNERLEALLKQLQEKGLTLNIDKCQFNMDNIEFMGLNLSETGVRMTENKVEAIINARQPQNSSEVKSFLGLVNFSARFIPNMASIAEPLRKLTRKSEPFIWGDEQQQSFDNLKESLSTASNLGYFDRRDKTQVICDAGPVGIGCVLVQVDKRGDSRVIMYASRALTRIERKYSQTEKEALSIVWACERLHMYLVGSEFELLTDHKPLQFIFSPTSKPCARVERWVLRLQPYKYTVKHIPGQTNIADALSRLIPECDLPLDSDFLKTEEYVNRLVSEATPVAMTTETIEKESINDPELCQIRELLVTGRWYELKNKSYLPIRHELSSLGHLILRGTRIVMPSLLRDKVLELGHEGHPGIVVMKQRLRSKLWWPGMDRDIEKYCKTCYGCQLVTPNNRPEPMIRRDLPEKPWQHLCADILGPLPSGENLFVVVDYYSRWKEIFILKTVTSEKLIQCLKSLFAVHGLPLSVQTDNAQYFNSAEFNDYLSSLSVEHRNTTPLWPQANGEVEVQNKGIMKRIRIAHAENRNWKEELQTYLMMYRSTPHTVTGISPAELLFKRKIRTKIPEISDYSCFEYELKDRDSEQKGKGKIYGDSRRRACESLVKKGDTVLVKQKKQNKLSTVFDPKPMSVLERKGNSVLIESDSGARYSRNVSHVKKFNQKIQEGVSDTDSENSGMFQRLSESVSIVPTEPNEVNEKLPSERESPLAPDSIPVVEPTSADKGREVSPVKIPRPRRDRKMPARFSDYIVT